MIANHQAVTHGDISPSSSQPTLSPDQRLIASRLGPWSLLRDTRPEDEPSVLLARGDKGAEPEAKPCVQLYHHTRAINLRDIVRDGILKRTVAYLRRQDRVDDPKVVHLSAEADALKTIAYEQRIAAATNVPWWGDKTKTTISLEIPKDLTKEPDYDRGNVYRWRRWAICRQWDKQWWVRSMDMRGHEKWWVAERDLPLDLFAWIEVRGERLWTRGEPIEALLRWADEIDAVSNGYRSRPEPWPLWRLP